MANVQHSTLTGSELHEPKGASGASSNQTYVSNGAGSGNWSEPEPKGASGATVDQVYVADGAGSGAWTTWPTGFGFYEHNVSGQVFNTTASKLEIDGAGSQSTSAYLPRAIRGSGELWDTVNDEMTPIAVGDVYMVRLTIPIASKSGSPTILTLEVDISGAASPTTVISTRDITTDNTAPFSIQVAFPVFIGSTALANGIQFFCSTDTGTVTLDTGAEILISRIHGEL